MKALFEQMGEDINHPQWQVLAEYVRRFASVHPDCLDWITVAVEHPRILIGLLLLGDPHLFEIVYEWEDYLPFKWWMLPIKDWQAVTQGYLQPFANDKETTKILSAEIERTLRRFDERSDTFKIILEYLTTKVLGFKEANGVLSEIEKRGIDKAWDQLERFACHSLIREKSELRWPEGIDRKVWNDVIISEHWFALRWLNTNAGYQKAVFDAPLAAAYFSIVGVYPKQSYRAILSAFRDFHPEWFDTAFRAVQAILLTQLNIGEV
jgi:hypothetical protein